MKNNKKWLWWLPAAAVMIFIFCMSQMDGNDSSNLSGCLVEKLQYLAALISPSLAKAMADMPGSVEFVIRKMAHAAEYAALGGCLVLPGAFHLEWRGKALAGFCVGFSALYACSDELHQLFIADRAGRLFDVGVDTLGACAGTLFVMLLIRKRLQMPEK